MAIYNISISDAIYYVHSLEALYSKICTLTGNEDLASKVADWAEYASSLEVYKANGVMVEVVK